ncbi:hypothetical protein [Streptomyces europaeiscabiei]|uniref:hypothetical protein n=1 Tax=Streptomyces europaeiscabiei TaxID=146819 RepID=UPI0038F81DB0
MSEGSYVLSVDEASLDQVLSGTVHGTGALAAGVYLLSAAEPVLCLAAVCGVPVMAAAPHHIRTDDIALLLLRSR